MNLNSIRRSKILLFTLAIAFATLPSFAKKGGNGGGNGGGGNGGGDPAPPPNPEISYVEVDRNGNASLKIANIDGSNQTTVFSGVFANVRATSLRPGADQIAYARESDLVLTDFSVGSSSITVGSSVLLANFGGEEIYDMEFSPSGQKILVVVDGGNPTTYFYIYDIASQALTLAGTLPFPENTGTATWASESSFLYDENSTHELVKADLNLSDQIVATQTIANAADFNGTRFDHIDVGGDFDTLALTVASATGRGMDMLLMSLSTGEILGDYGRGFEVSLSSDAVTLLSNDLATKVVVTDTHSGESSTLASVRKGSIRAISIR